MFSVPTDVSCDEWAFSLLPLDVDLLSMELPEFFRDYFLVMKGPGILVLRFMGSSGLEILTSFPPLIIVVWDSDFTVEGCRLSWIEHLSGPC